MGRCLYQVLAIVLIGLNVIVKEGKSQWNGPTKSECLKYCNKDCSKDFGSDFQQKYNCRRANEECYCGVKEDKSQHHRETSRESSSSRLYCQYTCRRSCSKYDNLCRQDQRECKCGFPSPPWHRNPDILGGIAFLLVALCGVGGYFWIVKSSPNSRLVDNQGPIEPNVEVGQTVRPTLRPIHYHPVSLRPISSDNQDPIQPNAGVEPNFSQPGTTHHPSAPALASGAPVSTQVLYNPGSNKSNFSGRSDGLPSYSEVVLENTNNTN